MQVIKGVKFLYWGSRVPAKLVTDSASVYILTDFQLDSYSKKFMDEHNYKLILRYRNANSGNSLNVFGREGPLEENLSEANTTSTVCSCCGTLYAENYIVVGGIGYITKEKPDDYRIRCQVQFCGLWITVHKRTVLNYHFAVIKPQMKLSVYGLIHNSRISEFMTFFKEQYYIKSSKKTPLPKPVKE